MLYYYRSLITWSSSPYEVAETSAVGRALAFAGYAGTEIASAEEMVKAITQPIKPKQTSNSNTRRCAFHDVDMPYAVAKSGKGYYGHKVGKEFCFGKGTDSEQESEMAMDDVMKNLN